MPLARIKRRIFAGVLSVAVAIGVWMSGLIPRLGNGSGDGDGTADPTASVSEEASVSDPETPTEAQPQPAPTENAAKSADEPQEKKPGLPRLTVYVDGSDYAVPLRSGGYRRVSGSAVLRLARTTTGDDDGIRVRVRLTKEARYNAWSRLVDELIQANIPRTAISIPEEMYELPGDEVTAES